MATQKKAWLSALATFVLIAVIGVTFAFKSESTTNKAATQVWYYTPNTAPTGSQIYDSSRYTSSSPENCGGETTVPCEISFTENANYSTLAQYLAYQQAHSLPVNIISYKDL